MPSPGEIVRDFLSRWETVGGFAEAVRDYFTPATVWENVGMTKTTGPEEACAVFAGFGLAGDGQFAMRVDTLAMAVTGSTVLTERIDHVLGPDGQPALSFPVAGVFEVADGRITAWRDYFDTAGLASQGQG